MTTINSKIVTDMYHANLIYELHQIKDKINLFAAKYGSKFDEFEKEVKTSKKESFAKWDDYIEWKGYEQLLRKFSKEKKDLEIGNYKVS